MFRKGQRPLLGAGRHVGSFCAFGFVKTTSDGGKITSDGEEDGLEMGRPRTSAGEGDNLRNGFRDGNLA